jgi:hypothetical protein
MPILKSLDETFVCAVATTPDDVLANIFGFNDLLYVETDVAGSQLQNLNPTLFFAVNRVLTYGPVVNNSRNRYAQMKYDCMLTIARPSDARQEVETLDVPGQFDEITKELLTLDFINTFKSYFSCCDHLIEAIRCRPVWNVNTVVPAVNYSGVEITFSVTI